MPKTIPYLTIPETADFVGVAPGTIRNQVDAGRIPSVETAGGTTRMVHIDHAKAYRDSPRKPGRPSKQT